MNIPTIREIRDAWPEDIGFEPLVSECKRKLRAGIKRKDIQVDVERQITEWLKRHCPVFHNFEPSESDLSELRPILVDHLFECVKNRPS